MESINAALIDLVRALGGSKTVGPMLWPEKTMEAAQRALLDALNAERPAHLTPEQTLFLLKKGREIGYHAALEWICADVGYSTPTPIAPKDEIAELQRQFIEAVKAVQTIGRALEAKTPGLKLAV